MKNELNKSQNIDGKQTSQEILEKNDFTDI